MSDRWRAVVGLCRTVHIYLTLFGLVLIVFFALTGVMLVHAEWLGLDTPATKKVMDVIPAPALKGPDKLAVVEYLRSRLGAAGAVESFEVDPDELRVVLRRPSRRDEAIIDRRSGEVTLIIEAHGPSVVLTDLHKDFASGPWWWVIVDLAAVLMLLASVSGLVFWCALPRRRWAGIAFLAGGTIACVMAYLLLVP